MQKKETQYLKGLSEVSAGYQAIVNSQVTGEEMNKRKQEYIKTASDGLSKISSSDLSLPTNSTQAQNLYAPFWQDDLMVKNIGLTKSAHNEISKAYSWRDSKDEGLRSQYNDYTVIDIQQGLQELAQAPVDRESYNKLEMRRATPVYDIMGDANKELSTMGDKGQITSVDASGAVLRVTGGGPKSVPGYNAFFRSVAERPKYGPQIKMIGRVQANTKMGEMRQYNEAHGLPTNDSYIKTTFGQYIAENLQKYYTDGIKNYREKARETRLLNDKIFPVDVNGRPTNENMLLTPEQVEQVRINEDQAKAWDNLAGNLENRASEQIGYDPSTYQVNLMSPAYQGFIRNVTTSPADYYGNLYIQEQGDMWAAGKASITSEEIKENPIWKAFTEQSNKEWEQKFKIEKEKAAIQDRRRALTDKEWVNWAKYRVPPDGMTADDMTGYSGPGIPSGQGGTGIDSGSVAGYTGTDVYKEEHPLDKFQAYQQSLIGNINRTTFDYDGLSRVMSSEYIADGLDMSSIVDFSANMQQSMVSGTYNMDDKNRAAKHR